MIFVIIDEMYQRCVNVRELLKAKSLLLLGPRQTGKSTLITSQLPEAYVVNLAQRDLFRELSGRPELLRQRLPESAPYLVVDEAQLLPDLFDEVQVLIDRNPKLRVVLTGSSARKLRRKGVNLLPGRIWRESLFPLVSTELGSARIADRVARGSLPGMIDSEFYKTELSNYVGLYLEEEIRAEAVTRQIGDFSRFLTVAGLCSGEQVNFSKVSNDAQVKINTVRAYYQILQDTLIGFELESFRETKSRKAVATPKFYLFDTGVVNGILNRYEVIPGTETYGRMLEHIVLLELRAYIHYSRKDSALHYWRSQTQLEVDFLVQKEIGIEVKASAHVSDREQKALLALEEDIPLRRRIIVCHESAPRKTDQGTEVLPVETFFQMLWSGEIF